MCRYGCHIKYYKNLVFAYPFSSEMLSYFRYFRFKNKDVIHFSFNNEVFLYMDMFIGWLLDSFMEFKEL